MHYWGIDLGGTKIEAVVINKQNEVLVRKRVPTEAHMGYKHVIGQVNKLVQLLINETETSPFKLGICTPGTTDPVSGILKNCNAQSLNGKTFQADLQKMFGIKVKMANDANCFVLAETRMGVIQDLYPEAKLVFGVIIGTGVGGGIVINGKVWNGRHGIGGEWGHSSLGLLSKNPCYCGNNGCVEQVLSGPNIEAYYEKQSGQKKSLKEIAKAYHNNSDQLAKNTMDRMLHFFGLSLSNVINILDPDAIVLGGGVSNIDLLYTEGVKSVANHVFNPTFDTPILRPKLGDSAGVFGAAFL